MDLKEIQALIKFVAKSGAQEVSLETEDFKINIKTGPDASDQPTYVQAVAPQQMPAAAPAATPVEAAPTAPAEVDDSDNYITIKSPMIGTFYRTPSPDQDAFVKIGDTIEPGDVLCIVEAMKLFNEIESKVVVKIVQILVNDKKPIDYNQPLFLVDPS